MDFDGLIERNTHHQYTRYIYIYVCMYVCMYIYIYVCIYTIYIYIYLMPLGYVIHAFFSQPKRLDCSWRGILGR